MKRLICSLLLMVSLAEAAQALALKDLVGNWTGTHKEVRKGTGLSLTVSIRGKMRADGALVLTENSTQGMDMSARHVFAKNGKFTSETLQHGMMIIGSYSGTWKKKDGKILISAKGTLGKLGGTLEETKTGIRLSGKASNGQSILITGKER